MAATAASTDWAAWTSAATPWFSLEGNVGPARLLDAHDGDTITVAAEVLGATGCVRQFKVRLHGIDTPEATSRNPAEREAAQRARKRLVELLAPAAAAALPSTESGDAARKTPSRRDMRALLQRSVNMVHLRCVGMDKYGRALAHVSRDPDGPSVAEALVDEGLAVRYDGGTKPSWN